MCTLVLVNNASDLFQIAATYGSGKKGEDAATEKLPMVMVKRHAQVMVKLDNGDNGPVEARFIPLQCPSGGDACLPILPEEQDNYRTLTVDAKTYLN